MTVEYVQTSLYCDKCGGMMIPRKIISQEAKLNKVIHIIQCDICRFWQEK